MLNLNQKTCFAPWTILKTYLIGTIKSPKLSELLEHLKITEENILNSTNKLFNSDETYFHDARFDTTALYLAIIKSIKLNLINNGYFSNQI